METIKIQKMLEKILINIFVTITLIIVKIKIKSKIFVSELKTVYY